VAGRLRGIYRDEKGVWHVRTISGGGSGSPAASQSELPRWPNSREVLSVTKEDYTLRRVLYYMMVVARSLKILSNKECDYPAREAAKCGALISLRALSVFLTDDHTLRRDGSRRHRDDVLITDFNLPKGRQDRGPGPISN